MKNPLADAIRQSGDKDRALSDSGSFDTRRAELGPTANDAEVREDGIDFELLESTGAIVLSDNDSDVRFEVHGQPVPEPDDATAEAETILRPLSAVTRAPSLARFSPLVCIAAALLAATTWSVYHYLQIASPNSALPAPEMLSGGVANDEGGAQLADAERFPFISEALPGELE